MLPKKPKPVFTPFGHQVSFARLWGENERVLNFDGCGTGKTLACIHAVKTYWPEARVLVLAPLSILTPAWAKDLRFGWPETTYAIASGTAAKKRKALKGNAQWVRQELLWFPPTSMRPETCTWRTRWGNEVGRQRRCS